MGFTQPITQPIEGAMGKLAGRMDSIPKPVKIAMMTGALPGGAEMMSIRSMPGMPGAPKLIPTSISEAMPTSDWLKMLARRSTNYEQF